MTLRHIILLSVLAAVLPAGAQELNGQLTVHGVRRAEVQLRNRPDVFPAEETPAVELTHLLPSAQPLTADYTPGFMPLVAPGWRSALRPLGSPGYFVFGTGTFLDMTASAGYSARLAPHTTGGAWLQYDGSSLYRPGEYNPFRRRYDGSLGINVTHDMGRRGTLKGDAVYSLGYFNYYAAPGEPSQTRNSARVTASWESASVSDKTFAAALDYRYFGFRRTWLPAFATPYSAPGQGENSLKFTGRGAIGAGKDARASLDAELNMLFYSGEPGAGSGLAGADNYGRLRLRPGYRLRRPNLNLDIGVRLDMMWDAGIPSDRFGFFHAAPDIHAAYGSGMLGLQARFTGGTELQTLGLSWQQDYYTLPRVVSTTPVYSPLDAALGVELHPGAGFHFGLAALYKISNNHNPAGWYVPMLDGRPGLDNIYSPAESYDSKGFGAELTAGWSYSPKARIDFRGRYTPRSSTGGYWSGIDRPRWVLGINAEISPLEGLHIYAGYDYRGVRTVSSRSLVERIPDLALLTAGASYNVWRGLTLWLRGGNMLGCHATWSPGLEGPGFSMTGGLQLTF